MMRIKVTAVFTVWLVATGLAAPELTAVPPATARPNAAELRRLAWAKGLVPRLAGAGAAARKAALSQITWELRTQPYPTAPLVYQYWLPPLMDHGHYRAVANLAMRGILAAPAYTFAIDRLLVFRIQALAAMHKNAAALRDAKSLFDVCRMQDTGTALLILDQRLDAVYRKHPNIVRRFVLEERSGAKMPSAGGGPIERSRVLASIQVHAGPYLARLKAIHSTGSSALMEKGDLWLLADQPAKALRCFQSMEAYAKTSRQLLLLERFICRAIRAEDGTIGRANAHLLRAIQGATHPQ
jgi:hypothetical protein